MEIDNILNDNISTSFLGIYSDILLRIIGDLHIKDIILLRLTCKTMREVVRKISELSFDQTDGYFLLEIKNLRKKYEMFKRIMPSLKSMQIHLSFSYDSIPSLPVKSPSPSIRPVSPLISPDNMLIDPVEPSEDPSEEWPLTIDYNKHFSSTKDFYTSTFSWLKDIDVKIDCSLDDLVRDRSEENMMLAEYLVFTLRGNFSVNKFREYVGSGNIRRFTTTLKIKEGIMTISHGFTAASGCSPDSLIYKDQGNVNSLKWDGIKGLKIKYPIVMYKGRCHYLTIQGGKKRRSCTNIAQGNLICLSCDTEAQNEDVKKRIYIYSHELLDGIKHLPITVNKTSVLKYI